MIREGLLAIRALLQAAIDKIDQVLGVEGTPADETTKPKLPPRSLLLWNLASVHSSWVEKAATQNIARLYLKAFDSLSSDSLWSQTGEVPKLVARGFSVGTWSYEYTHNAKTGKVHYPVKEKIAANLNKLAEMGVTHHIFDFEVELESNAERLADCIDMLKYVKSKLKKPMTLGFTSFGWGSKHPGFPYKELAKHVDFHAPQIYTCYWTKDRHVEMTKELLAEFEAMKLGIPTYPMISTENHKEVPYPLTEAQLKTLLDTFEGALVWRLHDANNSTAVTLKVDYQGKLNTPKEEPKPELPSDTSFAEKLHAYYSKRSNYDAVSNNVASWRTDHKPNHAHTWNGCVAFHSACLRLGGGIGIPNKTDSRGESIWLVTRPFRNYLESIGWKRVSDPSVLVPGDTLFSLDEPGWHDYPAHVYMFDKWVNKPYTATVIDNQGFKYVRNIASTGSKTPFAYALRPS